MMMINDTHAVSGAGLIKIRGGQEWRDLTAMDHFYEVLATPPSPPIRPTNERRPLCVPLDKTSNSSITHHSVLI
jgi:hypothetical protein